MERSFYVYRLADPRNGQTFYVGKGTGTRYLDHIRDAKSGADGAKCDRIREIIAAGHFVDIFIQRDALDEISALEVEAALIDFIPGLTNVVSGTGRERRCRRIPPLVKAPARIKPGRERIVERLVWLDEPPKSPEEAAALMRINRERRQQAGIELARQTNPSAYRGRKPSYSRDQLATVTDALAGGYSISHTARMAGLSRQTVHRIKDDPAEAFKALEGWGLAKRVQGNRSTADLGTLTDHSPSHREAKEGQDHQTAVPSHGG